jgi:hypothetical protein
MVLIPVLFVASICAVMVVPELLHGRDSREYANADDSVTYGSGSLDHDILPHYQVTLPCDTTNLHYADDESLIGPEGTLYLSFATSATCLQTFVASLTDHSQATGGSLDFPHDIVQPRFGWTFQASKTYDIYGGGDGDVNVATVVVDSSSDPAVVWMKVDHS